MRSTALRTDHYELTMLEAALASGAATRKAAFELFSRHLPEGRRFGIVGGIGRMVEAIEDFRFGDDERAWLREAGFLQASTIEWLGDYRFAGEVRAYREGEVYFAFSPVVTVEATFAEAVVLETVLLSIVNHDSAVASAAARIVHAAGGRPLIEMGGRRTHESAAVAAARVAYLCGFASTSNLEAGRRYGIPTRGTAAHAFTLAHDDELSAFRAQLASADVGTTLLVDTYDTATGIRRAVEAAGTDLAAVRIDSGDLLSEAEKARALLDELGAMRTRIVVTGDLDEHSIAELVECGAPIDGFGVGTQLVTGSGHPTSGFVYKLVAIEIPSSGAGASILRPVAKTSAGKGNMGGVKTAWRVLDSDGLAVGERLSVGGSAAVAPGDANRGLQVDVIAGGSVVHRPTNDEVRAHHRAAMAELHPDDLDLSPGSPRISASTTSQKPQSSE